MTTLIVTLATELADASTSLDYVLSADGSTVSAQSNAPLALLPPADELVAMVPARHLSWHQVTLPKGVLPRGFMQDSSTVRLRAVLDGLLEERLLDDSSQLHFALEPEAQVDAPVWVAACDRRWLQVALQAMEQAGRPVSRVVPEFAPGSMPDTLYVMGSSEQPLLVSTARGGVTVWPLSGAVVTLLGWPAEQAVVAEPAVVGVAEQLLDRTVTVQPSAQRSLQAAQTAWDLAQFEMVSSGRSRFWKRGTGAVQRFFNAPAWRAARISVVALLAVNLLGLNAWAWKERTQVKAQRQAVQAMLTDTFPSVRVVVDAPLQMAREVAALQQASGDVTGRDLETLLAVFSAEAPASVAASAIEFRAGELRMNGLSLSPDDVAQVSFKLKAQGFTARQDGDQVVVKQGLAP
jgi:general secretion pathway protein L